MSKVIAIAGGSGGIGQHVLDGLLEAKKYKLIVLSRKEQPEFTSKGIDVRVVDYESVDSLKQGLQGVDTLISGLTLIQNYVQLHQNIIKACEETGVKRFIPSEWAHDIEKYPSAADLYADKERVRELLEKSKLEYTLIGNGLFMDYLLPVGGKKYLKDVPIPVDVPKATAVIPGDGESKVTLTLGEDIGKAVAVLVAQPSWGKYTLINGETTTWNNIVKTAEKITGKKFSVTYKPIKDLEESFAKRTGMMERFYAQVDIGYAEGKLELHGKPDYGFQFTTVEQLLQKTYGK